MKHALVLSLVLAGISPLFAASVRLAIAPSGNGRAVADLLTAELAARRDVILLERGEIERVYRELATSGQQRGGELRLGQLLGANGVLTVDQTGSGLVKLQLIAVGPGVILNTWTNDAKIALTPAWSTRIAARIDTLLPKLLVLAPEAVPVSILNFRSSVDYEGSKALERTFTLLVTERLTAERQLFVLERRRMEMLVSEKELQPAESSAFWNGSFLIDGVLDQKAIDAATLSVTARILPPRGGTPMTIETSGPRTNIALVVQALTGAIVSNLNTKAGSISWNAKDEAQRMFDDAKWARAWGLLADAQTASEASWALGMRGHDITELRIASYAEMAQPGNSWTYTDRGVVVDEEPIPERLSAIVRALDLFAEASAFETNSNQQWCALGVDLVQLGSLLLQRQYLNQSPIGDVQNDLATLRARCRDVIRWIEENPSLRTNDWSRSESLLNVNVSSPFPHGGKNSPAMKAALGGFWQETPESISAMYLQLLGSPVSHLARRHLLRRERQDLRFPDWRTRQPDSDVRLWPEFCRRLTASADPALRLHGEIFELNDFKPDDVKHHAELLTTISNLVLELESHRSEFLSGKMDPGLVNSAADVIIQRCSTVGSPPPAIAFIRSNLWPRARRILETNAPAPAVVSRPAAAPVTLSAALVPAEAIAAEHVLPQIPLADSKSSVRDMRVTAWRFANDQLWTQVFLEEGRPDSLGGGYFFRANLTTTGLANRQSQSVDFDPPERFLIEHDWPKARRYFELDGSSVWLAGEGSIRRLSFSARRAQEVSIVTEGNPVISAIGDHLYLSSMDAILRFHKTTKALTVLASSRRRPSVSSLDRFEHLGYPPIFAGPSNSILAVVNGQLFRLEGDADWKLVLNAPPLTPVNSFGNGQGWLFFLAGALWPEGPSLPSPAPRLLLLQPDFTWRQFFGAPLDGCTLFHRSWNRLDSFGFAAFALETNCLWVLQNMRPLELNNSSLRLLRFDFVDDQPDSFPLVFSKDKKVPSPFSTREATVNLIATPDRFIIVGAMQSGWWEIPRKTIDAQVTLQSPRRAALLVQRANMVKADEDRKRAALLSYPGYEAKFRQFDTNCNGGLEFTELYGMFRTEPMLVPIRPAHGSGVFPWRDIFNAYDLNRDRKIDLNEFKNMLVNPELSIAPGGLWGTNAPEAWREFDDNRNGFIDINELRNYSKARGALRAQ